MSWRNEKISIEDCCLRLTLENLQDSLKLNAFVKVYKPVKNISIINKKYLIKTLTETSGYKDASDKNLGVLSLFTVLSRLQKINKDDRN